MSKELPAYKNKRGPKRDSMELARRQAEESYEKLPELYSSGERRAAIAKYLESVQNELVAKAAKTVDGMMQFGEVDVDSEGQIVPGTEPPEWANLPKRERQRAERMAKVGWMRSSDVPHAAKMAQALMAGYMAANANKEIAQAVLNIAPAQMPIPVIQVNEEGKPDGDGFEVIDE